MCEGTRITERDTMKTEKLAVWDVLTEIMVIKLCRIKYCELMVNRSVLSYYGSGGESGEGGGVCVLESTFLCEPAQATGGNRQAPKNWTEANSLRTTLYGNPYTALALKMQQTGQKNTHRTLNESGFQRCMFTTGCDL